MPKIVQFLHTGVEATPEKGVSEIPWNNLKKHRRKFLLSPGKFINENGNEEEQNLTFWGEWEAQSKIIKKIQSGQTPPTYLNQPYLNPTVEERTHNTDPYVFGKRFKYIVCMQSYFHNVMKNLEDSSIILFGSSINAKFCVDTVFVVSRSQQKYNIETIEELFPKNKRGQYYHASVKPMYDDTNYNENVDEEDSCRISAGEEYSFYESVDFQDRAEYNMMYSFVPCKTFEDGMNSGYNFRQPEIKLDFIKGSKKTGVTGKYCTQEEIKSYWLQIVQQVEEKGLLKGTWFKTPEMVRE